MKYGSSRPFNLFPEEASRAKRERRSNPAKGQLGDTDI